MMTSMDDYSALTILLVDDESFVRRVTARVLGTLKIPRVLEAENGQEAIALLKQNKVDLLITDIQMPVMNGIELIKQIRMGNTAADRGLRTIVVTSFSNTEVLGSCLLLDINGFLVKPITADSAADKIRIAMRERRSLNSKEAYQQVRSDLASLGAMKSEEKENRVNAAIVREPVKSTIVGGSLIAVSQLRPGMELLEDLNAHNGIKLLTAGSVLNEGLINRLLELNEVIHNVKVRVKPHG